MYFTREISLIFYHNYIDIKNHLLKKSNSVKLFHIFGIIDLIINCIIDLKKTLIFLSKITHLFSIKHIFFYINHLFDPKRKRRRVIETVTLFNRKERLTLWSQNFKFLFVMWWSFQQCPISNYNRFGESLFVIIYHWKLVPYIKLKTANGFMLTAWWNYLMIKRTGNPR